MSERELRDEIEALASAVKREKQWLEGVDDDVRALRAELVELQARREAALESRASSQRVLEETRSQAVMLRSSLNDARLRIAEIEARTKRPGFFGRLFDVFR